MSGARLSRLRPRGLSRDGFGRLPKPPSHITSRSLNHFIERGDATAAPIPPRFSLAIKDNIATADLPTTCASDMLADHRSPFEATIVAQLRARGAEPVGKTNLDEFAMGSHSASSAAGAVRRPDGRSAGGSSGGSALAVRDADADLALGTDTGGSVRLPAAYCGVAGFKPSYGMLSRHGVVPYANSLDTVGLLAARVGPIADLVIDSRLYAEHDPRDPTSLPPAARHRCTAARDGYGEKKEPVAGLTFGLPLEYNVRELDSPVRAAWAAAADRLQDLGARVVPVSLPSTRHALSAYYVLAPAEASSNLAKYDGVRYGPHTQTSPSDTSSVLYADARRRFGDEVRRRILLGAYTLSSEARDNYFVRAQRVRRLVCRDFDAVFRLTHPLRDAPAPIDLCDLDPAVPLPDKLGPAQVDFLLCPTAPTLAPPLYEVAASSDPVGAYTTDVLTVPASLAGLPAISIPAPITSSSSSPGDVAGLQLIGQYWDDARLLAAAGALESSLAGG